MNKRNAIISLNGQWTMEGKNLTDGLTHKAYKPDYKPEAPVPAMVPGIVQSALYEAGMVDDPYFEDGPENIKWVEEKEWWFFKDFAIPEDTEGKRYILLLEGITYRAEVWVNGVNAGHMEGMFQRGFLDVTDLLSSKECNRISLRIRAQEMAFQDYPGSHIGRRVIMSTAVVAPFSYFWNWSPHMAPIGIWKPINLKVVGDAELRDPFVQTAISWSYDNNATAADITASVEIRSYTRETRNSVIKGVIKGIGFDSPMLVFEKKIELEPDAIKTVELQTKVDNPQLWWPNGMGEHPLYQMILTVEDENRVVQDEIETEFGIRELDMICNDDDVWVQNICGHTNRPWATVGDPYPWTFYVNRRRLFVRGSNWLPTDSLFRFTEERYRMFLDQAEDAKVNMLRVWGGGIHETEVFYRMCSRKGILAWTEFWLACSSYPAMPHDLFINCAIDMIKVLRNHACLAMWSGGNEYNPDEPENKRLVDKIEKACRKYDPTRSFHRGSPYRGDRHGGMIMLPTRTTNKYGDLLSGDSRMVLFRSEIAVMRSAPSIQNIRKFIGSDKIWPIDRKTWEYHHAKIAEQERDAKEYGGTCDLEHWLMSGHLVHGQNHRHNMEYCRQNKYHTSGCMQWQLNGSWPSFHRELIDWYGTAKPAFYAYKRAMRDCLAVADMEKYIFDANEEFTAKIYAISEKPYELGEVCINAVIYDRTMRQVYKKEGKVFVSADASVHAFDIGWKVPGDYLEKVFFLHLEMHSKGEVISDNFYWMGTSTYSRPDELIDLKGSWQVQVGDNRGQDAWQLTSVPGRPYRIRQIDEAAFHLTGGLVEAPEGTEQGFSVYYSNKFEIPAEWKDVPLEFFCAGLEGNDEVWINGVRIGGTEQKKNILFQSDPFRAPNIVKCFYPIPAEIIRWDNENVLDIRLYGDNVTGISEPVYIRRLSSSEEMQAVIDFDNKGEYLSDLKNLPYAQLEVKTFCDIIQIDKGQIAEFDVGVKNAGSSLSFFTGLSLVGLEGAAREFYSDNYFPVLPGEEKLVTIRLTNDCGFAGRKKIKIMMEGWNVKSRTLTNEVEVVLA